MSRFLVLPSQIFFSTSEFLFSLVSSVVSQPSSREGSRSSLDYSLLSLPESCILCTPGWCDDFYHLKCIPTLIKDVDIFILHSVSQINFPRTTAWQSKSSTRARVHNRQYQPVSNWFWFIQCFMLSKDNIYITKKKKV